MLVPSRLGVLASTTLSPFAHSLCHLGSILFFPSTYSRAAWRFRNSGYYYRADDSESSAACPALKGLGWFPRPVRGQYLSLTHFSFVNFELQCELPCGVSLLYYETEAQEMNARKLSCLFRPASDESSFSLTAAFACKAVGSYLPDFPEFACELGGGTWKRQLPLDTPWVGQPKLGFTLTVAHLGTSLDFLTLQGTGGHILSYLLLYI
jgi:hypothetical protein